MYPSISQYLDAINLSVGLFRSLTQVEFVRTEAGDPLFCAGGEAVVFKVKHNGRFRAMKLYTVLRKNRTDYFRCIERYFAKNSSDLVPRFDYYDGEISVYVGDGVCKLFPVLLIDWVDGESLGSALKRSAHLGRKAELSQLTDRFLDFCADLLGCDFAHLDLKPDNIMVAPEGRLRLIDIDALSVPGYVVDVPEEQGTFWFSHPCRKEYSLGKFLEEYPMVVILASLLLLEREPYLFERAHNGENVLFHPAEVLAMRDEVYRYALTKFGNDVWIGGVLGLLRSHTPRVAGLSKTIAALRMVRGLRRGVLSEADLCCFDACTPFFEGVAAVRMAERWAFVSQTGDFLSAFCFDAVERFSEGVVAAKKESEWRLLDQRMNELVCFGDAEAAGVMCCGVMNVKKEGLWGYYDCHGNLVIAHRYDTARPFKQDGTASVTENGVAGLIKRSV